MPLLSLDRILGWPRGLVRDVRVHDTPLARIASDPYPDPPAEDPKLAVVDVEAVGPLARPVTLAAVKADRALADLGLVRMSRLSVVPVSGAQWKRLMALAGER